MKYLNFYEKDMYNISTICETIREFIHNNFIIDLAKDIDQLQGFEINFIQPNINIDLDNKTQTLIDSNDKLECIRSYLNSVIESCEKKPNPNRVNMLKSTKPKKTILV